MSIYMEDNRDEEGFNQMGLLNKLLEYPQDTLEKSDNNIENQLTCDGKLFLQYYNFKILDVIFERYIFNIYS